MEFEPLIPVGSKIKVEKSKIENMLPKNIIDDLPQIIDGEVMDYKMTDGMDIGYVLRTDNNLKIWIFNNELNEQTKMEYKITEKNKSNNIIIEALKSRIDKFDYNINGNRTIKAVTNPLNVFSWLIYTLKDIF